MVLTRLHLYVGIDYPDSLPWLQRVIRRRFDGDASRIRDLLSDAQTEPIVMKGPISTAQLRDQITIVLGAEHAGRASVLGKNDPVALG